MQNRIQVTQTFYVSPAAAPFFKIFGGLLMSVAVLSFSGGAVRSLNKGAWTEFNSILPGASVIGIVGYGFWYLADKFRRARTAQVERFKQYPNKPWLWREDWATQRIVLSDRTPKLILTLFLFGVAFALYAAYRSDQAKHDGGMMSWSTIIIAVMAWMGFNLYMLNRRWRRSELQIVTLPGTIGGEFCGFIWLSDKIAPGTKFLAHLSCEELTWYRKPSSTDDGNGITTRILWSTEMESEAGDGDESRGKTPIPIAFIIPEKLEPTSMDEHPTSEDFDLPKGPARRVEWWVTLKPHDRHDFRSIRFCVPVFSVAPEMKPRKRKRSH